MPASHGKQKRTEKQKKRRDLARKKEQARRTELALPTSQDGMIRRAVAFPYGPSFISPSWRNADETVPELVSVVVTRRAPGGLFVPALALVDRTCLGVKNGFVASPVPALGLETFVAQVGRAHGTMEPCELLVAQSVVFHALDYARSLGFAPHRDFAEALFGPRPEKLLDTPLAKRSRPLFIPGPDDDVGRIMAKLGQSRGADFMVDIKEGLRSALETLPDELDEDDEGEGDPDEDEDEGA
jgi:hypothetical protein